MSIEQAMTMMKEARPKLAADDRSVLSVLNPAITAIDAWELVWRSLLQLKAEKVLSTPGCPSDRLADWLERRVRQVCVNKLNPDLPDDVKLPDPEPPPAPRPKLKPFERKFS